MSKTGKNSHLRVIPLGGVGEVGKNMWVVEYGEDLIVLDAGVMFPEDDMLGIDYVIPDVEYVVQNKSRFRAIILSHGHEDHIGALPYVLRTCPAPIYGTRLTLGLVEGKLEEHGLLRDTDLREVKAGDRIKIGKLELEFIHINHSIADTVAIVVHTPVGSILYCTDFKLDQTPIDGRVLDLQRFAQLGREGLLMLMSDSTNSERPGYTLSERCVGETFHEVFSKAGGRIVVATFASNIHRIQQVVDAAEKFDRKVCAVGRSMLKNVEIASRLGYLNIPPNIMIEMDELGSYPPEKLVVLSTGSQGEPMAALTRMAMAEHQHVEITKGDTVIISATAIPGNEKLIGRTVNKLFRQGANVIYQPFSGVHVSGHPSQEELKLMINLTQPKFFVPIHGEYRMLVTHAQIAKDVGLTDERIIIPEIGDVIEVGPGHFRKGERVASGTTLVDGLGVGDVGNIVLRDRRHLSQDGILIVVLSIDKRTGAIVSGPDIVTRGFVYVRESESLLEEAKATVRTALNRCEEQQVTEWGVIKSQVRDVLYRFIWERTKRRPMILPIIMDV